MDSISDRPLLEDGRLERYEGSTSILVRSDISPKRRRFTIAHELGHLLLMAPNSEFVAARHIIGKDVEERFCEDFAGALLLPAWWVKETIHDRPRTLHTLRVIAGRSNTSLAASCVRMKKISGWQSTLLCWNRHESNWHFQWAAGLPNGFEGRIRSSDHTSAILNSHDMSGDVDIELPLRISGTEKRVPAQVSVRHGSAIALAVLI
ncbi:ImmA/IrrE family metallo-endopeptidase [Candidatus Poriferisocius sp.]|uniref:ImmA/IrrE family metallo-endopeptidase n=1 Tax=Candidatus Poriferisocius sp. TaxID=3101276 RepID=UPI003B5B8E79